MNQARAQGPQGVHEAMGAGVWLRCVPVLALALCSWDLKFHLAAFHHPRLGHEAGG